MKILYVLTSLGAGGVGAVSRRLVKEIRLQGQDVFVLALKSSEYDAEFAPSMECFSYIKLGPMEFFGSFLRLIRFFIRFRDFDAVIVASDYPSLITILAMKVTCHPAAILVNSHTSPSVYIGDQSLFKKILFWAARYVYKWADAVANVSAGAAKDSKEFFNLSRTHTLYNPACTQEMISHVPQGEPHRWFRDSSLTVIVACGRLVESKNYQLMIDIFGRLYQERKDIRLLILGDGPLRQNLEEQVKKNSLDQLVEFVGQVDNPGDYYHYARFVWMTSFYEGLPTALIESLAAGTPCVSIDFPHGAREILCDGKFGCLVASYEMEQNKEAILEFLSTPAASREFYKQRAGDFLAGPCTAEYIALLEKLTKKSS